MTTCIKCNTQSCRLGENQTDLRFELIQERGAPEVEVSTVRYVVYYESLKCELKTKPTYVNFGEMKD